MKKLYSDYMVMGEENFFIDCDEARGMENFEKPLWFSEGLSFAYKAATKEDFFKKMRGETEITLQRTNCEKVRESARCEQILQKNAS